MAVIMKSQRKKSIPKKPDGLIERIGPWLIPGLFVFALLLRLIYLLEGSSSPFFDYLGVDAAQYHQRAVGFTEGTWPAKEAFFWPPLYPLLLGLFYKVFGTAATGARIMQAFLGSASCVLVFLIARQLFTSRLVPIIAAVLCCLCGAMIYFDAQLLSANLDVFLQLLVIFQLLVATRREHIGWWILAGVCAGLAAINRGSILLFLPIVLIWIFLQPRWMRAKEEDKKTEMERSWGWKRVAALLLPAGLIILPVSWHNAKYDLPAKLIPAQEQSQTSFSKTFGRLVTGRFVLLGSPVGVNFYIGNHWDFRELNDPNHPQCFTSYRRILEEPSKNGIRSASGSNRYLFGKTTRYIAENPIEWIKLMGSKILQFFNGAETPRNMTIYPDRQYSVLLSALLWKKLIAFPAGLIIPLGLVGIFLIRSSWRRHSLVLGCLLAQSIFVVSFFATARYRLPSIPILAIYAGCTLELLIHSIQKREYAKLTVPLILLVAFGILSNAAIGKMDSTHGAFEYNNLGVSLAQQGKMDEAIENFSKALQIYPDHVEAHMALGLALAQQGKMSEAMAHYSEGLRIQPDYAEGHLTMGQMLEYQGKTDEAIEHYSEAVRILPHYTEARMALALALNRQGKMNETITHLKELLRFDPNHKMAHFNLGVAFLNWGRLEEAVKHFSEAVRIDPNYAKAHYNLAMALENLGRTKEASAHYSQAARLGYRPPR